MKATDTLSPRARARRDNIMAAARRLFARQGIEQTTVDALVAEAGISRATFYRVFHSLSEVVEALYAEYEERVLERLNRDLSGTVTLSDADLTGLVAGVLADARAQGPVVRAMFREELRPGSPSEPFQGRRVQAQLVRVRRWWEAATGSPADDDLILCLILLLQSLGLIVSGRRTDPATMARYRDAAVFVLRAVIDAHVARG